ncbi:sulfurtransferase-like selenium metabolism protein YedF [Natranaerobius trueperi]|uniref:Sulfurtransferase-like selenium metabolism protein YedF n=1 Tax=Natranaerobius trueperi TaxID=759412 RepID=A0A226BVI3_9FIRM|nr:sulfurtransferase-like selenium metabolism protein YedF [Natranaerobius trueperi]OWZ83006.1 sulfurtransferase-like selenium metabolism protein YedF [Natranaerobius trueperi]
MSQNYILLITSDTLGEGDKELGVKLMSSYLHSLNETEILPTHILFMNSGVKLVTNESDSLEELNILEEKGVKLLACGTCLSYYSLEEKKAVGEVGNMHLSAELMVKADKVVTLS